MKSYQEPKTCGECNEYECGVCLQSLEEAKASDRACPLFEEREDSE